MFFKDFCRFLVIPGDSSIFLHFFARLRRGEADYTLIRAKKCVIIPGRVRGWPCTKAFGLKKVLAQGFKLQKATCCDRREQAWALYGYLPSKLYLIAVQLTLKAVFLLHNGQKCAILMGVAGGLLSFYLKSTFYLLYAFKIYFLLGHVA